MRHLIDPLDFSKEEVLNLLDLADDIASDRFRYGEVCRGKKTGNPVLRAEYPHPFEL